MWFNKKRKISDGWYSYRLTVWSYCLLCYDKGIFSKITLIPWKHFQNFCVEKNKGKWLRATIFMICSCTNILLVTVLSLKLSFLVSFLFNISIKNAWCSTVFFFVGFSFLLLGFFVFFFRKVSCALCIVFSENPSLLLALVYSPVIWNGRSSVVFFTDVNQTKDKRTDTKGFPPHFIYF